MSVSPPNWSMNVPPVPEAVTRLVAAVPSGLARVPIEFAPVLAVSVSVVPATRVPATPSSRIEPAVELTVTKSLDVMVPRVIEFASWIWIALAPVLLAFTVPVKSFACVSVITPPPVVKLAAPAVAACVMAPVCVMLLAPVAVTVSVPLPTFEVPSTMALASVTATAFAPELFRTTAPVKSLPADVSVITPAPAFTVVVPPTLILPTLCVTPVPVIDKSPVAVETLIGWAIATAPVLFIVTSPPPDWLMPLSVSGAAAFVRLMSPPVALPALKTPTAFALPSVVPPTELVASVPAVIAWLWPIVPAIAVSVTASAGVPVAPTVRPVLVVLPPPSSEVTEPTETPVASR